MTGSANIQTKHSQTWNVIVESHPTQMLDTLLVSDAVADFHTLTLLTAVRDERARALLRGSVA